MISDGSVVRGPCLARRKRGARMTLYRLTVPEFGQERTVIPSQG